MTNPQEDTGPVGRQPNADDSLVVAIDGPAGSGKSTVAQILSRRYHLLYIDSGAMYRCVALRAQRLGLSPGDETAVTQCAQDADLQFQPGSEGQRVWLDGEDVTVAIREPEISSLASLVSQIAGVRKAMTTIQRQWGRQGRVVMEGRDIGTVVFPDARVKVFLTASVEERARRRTRELEESRPDANPDEAEVRRAVEERDRRDSLRAIAPLKPAADAVILNTDGLDIHEVVDRIAALLPDAVRSAGDIHA